MCVHTRTIVGPRARTPLSRCRKCLRMSVSCMGVGGVAPFHCHIAPPTHSNLVNFSLTPRNPHLNCGLHGFSNGVYLYVRNMCEYSLVYAGTNVPDNGQRAAYVGQIYKVSGWHVRWTVRMRLWQTQESCRLRFPWDIADITDMHAINTCCSVHAFLYCRQTHTYFEFKFITKHNLRTQVSRMNVANTCYYAT